MGEGLIRRVGLIAALTGALLTSGCPCPLLGCYRGDPNFGSDSPVGTPVGTYVPLNAALYSGGSPGPMEVESFMDVVVEPATCAHQVVKGRFGAVLRVGGDRPTTCRVRASFANPMTGAKVTKSVTVNVVKRGKKELITGLTRADILFEPHLLTMGDYSCRWGSIDDLESVGYKKRDLFGTTILALTCTAAEDLGSGRKLLFNDGPNRNSGDPIGDAAYVCVNLLHDLVVGFVVFDVASEKTRRVVGDAGPCGRE